MEEKMNSRSRRRRDMKEKEETHHLPHDLIITQILPRLPVKSLLVFKCVRKSWFSLISNPNFAYSHFQITAAKHTPKILFMSNHFQKTLSLDSESILDFHSAFQIPSPNFLHPNANFVVEIISSCRGFIFLHHSSKFQLWNPSTRAVKQIPLSPNELIGAHLCYLYGFGYDQSRDDYLVVTVSIYLYPMVIDLNSCVEFFSLRDNTWKEIDGSFPYFTNNKRINVPRVGLVFNGGIHWLAQMVERDDNVILAFDLMERKLLEMPYPVGYNYKLDEKCGLWVYGEFLSLWGMDYDNQRVEIWVMKEYKVDSSWTKAFCYPTNVIYPRYFSPLYTTKSGDIVGTDGNTGLLKYNDKGQLLEHKLYCEDPLGAQVTVYTESLLSLPGDNANTQA